MWRNDLPHQYERVIGRYLNGETYVIYLDAYGDWRMDLPGAQSSRSMSAPYMWTIIDPRDEPKAPEIIRGVSYCPRCGAEWPGSRYCPECGQRIRQET